MSFPDLRSFLSRLRAEQDIAEVNAPVDPHLELAEIHRRVISEGGPALIFHNVKGSSCPVVTNLFGTKRRVDLAFGSRPGELIRQAARLPEQLAQSNPPGLSGLAWRNRTLVGAGLKAGVKLQDAGAVKDVLEAPPALTKLPLITSWPEDGGPFITLPLVYTEHPETGVPNLGMYRMQRFSDTETGLHMQIGKGGGFHLSRAAELKQKLPVNVFLGGPPAAILSAIAPLPENVPEVVLASVLLGSKLKLAKNPKGPLPLLADAEFVLCGTCDPTEHRPEGPFGDHYGYYSLTHEFPVFRCSAVFRRKDAIYPATVVGKPRQEDFFIGDYLQELLSPLFPLVMPAVRDLWSYGETGFHSLAAAVVNERYRREAMASAFRILGESQLSLTKFLLAVDRPMELRSFKTVMEYVLERADFRTDLFVFANLSMDTLDYAGPALNEGSKGVLLGIGEKRRELPGEFSGELPAGINKARLFCRGCLVVSGDSFDTEKSLPLRIAQSPAFAKFPLIALVDDADFAAQDERSFLWNVFTRFEPAADVHAAKVELVRLHPSFTAPIVIDARMKPWYPGEVLCDEDTERMVSSRWREYFS